ALVSGFFTEPIRYKIEYRLAPVSVAKNAAAFGFASSAACKSGGTSALLADAYAASHRPSAFALSISNCPDACMRPSEISSSARFRFAADHLLRGRRGVKRISQLSASYLSSCPSIQPWQSALSIACALLTLATRE